MRRWKVQESKSSRILRIIILGAAAVPSLVLANGALRPRSVTAAQEKPGTTTVTIDNFSFAPVQLEIKAGTEVTWINKDDVPHTVVSDDHKLFKSRALDTDEKFSFTFKDPGTYEYFCSVHPKMTGKIIVK
ncbi:MAG TPA: cupredoxin family copper-binding protein [Candidatus Sulfotelmatobacter sp.]|jgi:plastocyanin|nr:cupredoxin family copper-binding protein [Candidatus Sulfotelmatobacter sp.]